MKCVLDRMQPYFWITQVKGRGQSAAESEQLDPAYVRHLRTKRPATLHVVGEGGDPHGFDPLVSEAKSALACAGFRLERVVDWVGKIDESGTIVAEAVEIALGGPVGKGGHSEEGSRPAGPADSGKRQQAQRQRPKLDLSAGQNRRQSESGGKRAKSQQKGKGKRRG